MAKLPHRGALIHPDGRLIWDWQIVDISKDYDAPSGICIDVNMLTGEVTTRILAEPDSIVVDLRDIIEPGEIEIINKEFDSLRIRLEDGAVKLRRIEQHGQEDGTVLEVEADHPLEKLRPVRRKARQVAFLHGLGFQDEQELAELVKETDLSTPARLAAFNKWKAHDGTKDGLIALRQPFHGQSARAALPLDRTALEFLLQKEKKP
jgi:hypothetical protein